MARVRHSPGSAESVLAIPEGARLPLDRCCAHANVVSGSRIAHLEAVGCSRRGNGEEEREMSLLALPTPVRGRALRTRRFIRFSLLSAAGVLVLYGCGTSGAATVARASNLTVQFAGPPISLNPALGGNGGSSVFTALDYDPLIYLTGSGKLVPDLATAWRFIGRFHRKFELTLRSGVHFSDGSLLNARAVVNSMRYFLKAGGSLVGNVGSIKSITAPNAHTVVIRYKTANPDAPGTLDQF